jgi:murein DD-endopeptidase MepM/ murein hydrolase activator NlpD
MVIDDDSFDPRSWTQKSANGSSLPDAWKAVAKDIQREPTPKIKPSKGLKSNSWQPFALSLAILVAGSASAWVSRPMVPQQPLPNDVSSNSTLSAEPDSLEILSSRKLVLSGPQDLKSALDLAGLPAEEATAANAAMLKALVGGNGEIRAILDLQTGPDGIHLVSLEASYADGSGAVMSRDKSGKITASRVAAELSKQIRVVSGELDGDSFYSSAVSAGVIDTLIPEFVNAFSFDFNLASEVSRGDTFEVAYEQTVNANGEPIGQPQLLYASLTTPTKSRTLYRFTPPGQAVGWFDGNGASTVRSFMRTPVDGARITSKFGLRFHPVLHYTRLHGGTDFAAPVGTPIYAAAGGVVASASPSKCAGNMVVMRHDNGWETRYFHLSQYADGLTAGKRVDQGSTIGLVGNTGTCTTGPHLHYEVHINGEKVDPQSIKTDSGRKALEGTVLAAFMQQRDRVDVARARHSQ